jgi:DNA-binding GntR family transcriptional regulator
VKELVMNLTIPPDSRINIDQLARDLQVSNTPLREALTRLETEGLITRRNLRGYWTTSLPDERGIRELYAVRLLLEPQAVEDAAASPAVAALTENLAEIIEQMTQSAQPELDQGYQAYRNFSAADARFHHAIAMTAGNKTMVSILAGLNAHAQIYRLHFRSGMADATINEHTAVLDALVAHDPSQAAEAMRTHLQRARDRLVPIAQSPRHIPLQADSTRRPTMHSAMDQRSALAELGRNTNVGDRP